MSWSAMNYVRRLPPESGIVGSLKVVLFMMAWRVPVGKLESLPTSLRWLALSAGVNEKTVRLCRNKLVAMRKVVIGQDGRGRGRWQTYILPELAGPLFMVTSDDVKQGIPPTLSSDEKAGVAPTITPEKRALRPGPVRTASSSHVRTQKRTTTTAAAADAPVAAAVCEQVLAFLQWWAVAYSAHHAGAQTTIDYERDGPRVERLLTGPTRRPPARLEAMALAMWTATVEEDAFIAHATDKGLKLLAYAADRLDHLVARRAQRDSQSLPWFHDLCPHTPKCLSWPTCQSEQAHQAREAAR